MILTLGWVGLANIIGQPHWSVGLVGALTAAVSPHFQKSVVRRAPYFSYWGILRPGTACHTCDGSIGRNNLGWFFFFFADSKELGLLRLIAVNSKANLTTCNSARHMPRPLRFQHFEASNDLPKPSKRCRRSPIHLTVASCTTASRLPAVKSRLRLTAIALACNKNRPKTLHAIGLSEI